MEKKGSQTKTFWLHKLEGELRINNYEFRDRVATKNIIQEKTYRFSVKVINVIKDIRVENKEFILTNQLIRSATSIGANVEESIGGQSDKDFLHKISIAYKEARETKYWLRLLKDTLYLNGNTADQLLDDCEEILRILGSIQKTLKSRNS